MAELLPYYGPMAGEPEARSYIAPFVDEFGRTHSAAVDFEQADFETLVQARRMKGLMDFQRLVDGGATEQEALRLTGRDLFAFEPSKMVKAAGKAQQNFEPYFTDVEGGRLLRRGPNSAQYIPTPRSRLTPETEAKQRLLLQQISEMRGGSAIDKLMEQNDPQLAAGRAGKLAELERQYLANAAATGDTQAATPAAPAFVPETLVSRTPMGLEMTRTKPPPPSTSVEKVIVIKNGKRFRLPKSQLAEAEKEGYKLAQ